MTIQEIQRLHSLIMMFERKEIKAADYINEFNAAGGFNFAACNTCGAFNAKVHSDFQLWFWRKVSELFPSLLPPTPLFNTARLNANYYQSQIPLWSFKLVDANIEKLRQEARENYKNSEYVKSLYADIELLKELRLSKESLSERNSKYSTEDMLRLKQCGWTDEQIADRVKLSVGTVSKRLKKAEAKQED